MPSQTPTRIYAVTLGETTRLVRASHPSTAARHVAKDLLTVAVATQEQLVQMVSKGQKVEVAGEEAEASV